MPERRIRSISNALFAAVNTETRRGFIQLHLFEHLGGLAVMTGIGIPLQRNRSPGPVRFQPLAKGAYPGEEGAACTHDCFLFKGFARVSPEAAGRCRARTLSGCKALLFAFFLERFIRIGIRQFNIGYYAFPLRGASVHPVEFLFGHFHKNRDRFLSREVWAYPSAIRSVPCPCHRLVRPQWCAGCNPVIPHSQIRWRWRWRHSLSTISGPS